MDLGRDAVHQELLRSADPVQLVVNAARLERAHSFALLDAEERHFHTELADEFPLLDDSSLVDALVYCDMTTTPDGECTTSEERVAEILCRYGADSVVGRLIRRAAPKIHSCVARVRAAADAAGVML